MDPTMSQFVQDKWNRKLENWALWTVSGSSRGRASFLDFGSSRHWADVLKPQPLIGEALDVDRLLHRLCLEHADRYAAVRAWYVWTGSLASRAQTLGIHPDTLRDRVRAARYRLEELEIIRRRECSGRRSNGSKTNFEVRVGREVA